MLTWRAADQTDPPAMDLLAYGWTVVNDIPVPVLGAEVAPQQLLQQIACGCKSCSRANCSCRKAGVSCTAYCKCEAAAECANIHTSSREDDHDVTETDEEQEVDAD